MAPHSSPTVAAPGGKSTHFPGTEPGRKSKRNNSQSAIRPGVMAPRLGPGSRTGGANDTSASLGKTIKKLFRVFLMSLAFFLIVPERKTGDKISQICIAHCRFEISYFAVGIVKALERTGKNFGVKSGLRSLLCSLKARRI